MPARAERYAILVGVDKYSFITAPTQQLRGAQTDVSMMKRMLEFYGYQSTVVLRSEATRKRLVDELGNIIKTAKDGDEVVFYFSGRGSIAPDINNPQSKSGMEPTLVPFDGSPTSLDPDIRIRRLEDWAKQLDTRGVKVSIILDCSFQSPTRSDFGRQYNPIPRSVSRSLTSAGEAREKLYDGPGAFMSASPARGSAYEWLQNSSESRWSGAFTDQFVNSIVAALNRGENPAFIDGMREAQAYFKDKVKADYMPGLLPSPDMATMMEASVYVDPAFGGLDVSKLPADSKASIAAQARIQAERERKFRVAIEIMEPTEDKQRLQTYQKASKDLEAFLKERLPNSEFAPVGSPPDVIVQVRADKNKLSTTVTGDDMEKSKVYNFTGKDLRASLNSGLGTYLELRSLVSRLYRLSATETPTWKAKIDMRADPISLARGETFDLDLSVDQEAMLFLLNRDDADGVLQIAFPQPGAPILQHLTAPIKMGGTIENDSSNGRMMLRAILIPFKSSVRIPEVDLKDETKFRESLVRQLKVVVDGIEKKRLEWTSKTLNLRIR
ncbi:MAG: caspase family protein [Chlorobia bacterium]|nr:caspase family protein [Fimbriimonadaceae bacterium]